MAYDKVVDSSVLDAGLKQIADAIREKSGSTGTLSFPTAMAEAIAAIESGGGGLSYISGSVTPSSDSNGITVMTKSELLSAWGGTMPSHFLGAYWRTAGVPEQGKLYGAAGISHAGNAYHYARSVPVSLGSDGYLTTSSKTDVFSCYSSLKIQTPSSMKFLAGEVYTWIMIDLTQGLVV